MVTYNIGTLVKIKPKTLRIFHVPDLECDEFVVTAITNFDIPSYEVSTEDITIRVNHSELIPCKSN